jgi:plastocyanin
MIALRRLAAAFVTGLVALGMSAAVASAQTSSGSVTIADFQFTPAAVQVAQGSTVTWTNNGPSNHTATSDTGAWDSGPLQPGKTFSFKFNSPGTFTYHCSIHPSMKGTITVTAAATSPASSPAASPTASAPAQLPKTGGGGGGTPGNGFPWPLGLFPLAVVAVWAGRRAHARRRS